MIQYIAFVFCVQLCTAALHSADLERKNVSAAYNVYCVPGMNGIAPGRGYMARAFGMRHVPAAINYHLVETPDFFSNFHIPDLGQNMCIRLLKKKLASAAQNASPNIIHASSQGAAAVLNYLGSIRDNRHKIDLVILESPVVSGNSAIVHTLKDSPLSYVPGANYVLPYLAQCMLPTYRPSGMQGITSAEHIDRSIPIIMIHSEDDRETPFSDCCALYHLLRAQKRTNIFFVKKQGHRHLCLLDHANEWLPNFTDLSTSINDLEKGTALQVLFRMFIHKGKTFDQDCAELRELRPYRARNESNSEYVVRMIDDAARPDHRQFHELYQQLIQREKNHRKWVLPLQIGIPVITVGLISRLVHYFPLYRPAQDAQNR